MDYSKTKQSSATDTGLRLLLWFSRGWEGGLAPALRGASRYLEMQIYPQELK